MRGIKKAFTTLIAATLIGTGAFSIADWVDPPAQSVFQPGQVTSVQEQRTSPVSESDIETDGSDTSIKSNETEPATEETASALYPVTRVIDGDTIEVEIDGTAEKVRLIGIDTPESVHPDQDRNVPYGSIASEFTKEQLSGKSVGLEFEVQERDKYGRLLAYVYLGGKMFNETLLEQGHAVVSTYPPNVKYVEQFTQLQQQAREQGVGLWSPNENEPAPSANGTSSAYIGNLNSYKFHYATCVHVSQMSDHNKIYFSNRNDAIAEGYQPCKTCHP